MKSRLPWPVVLIHNHPFQIRVMLHHKGDFLQILELHKPVLKEEGRSKLTKLTPQVILINANALKFTVVAVLMKRKKRWENLLLLYQIL